MDRPLAPHRWWVDDVADDARPRMVFDYVRAIEERQSDIRLRMFEAAYLYTGEELTGIQVDWIKSTTRHPDMPRINAVQSVIETAASRIAVREPRIQVTTRGGDWDLHQRAKGMEKYLDGSLLKMQFAKEWQRSFVDGAAMGTGLVKVYRSLGDEATCDRVFPPEIVVDEIAAHSTRPRAMFQRRFPDVDELAAEYPEYEDEIWKSASRSSTAWVSYINYGAFCVPVIDAWHLPPRPGIPGRHLVCIGTKVLAEEPWELDYFPFVEFRWMNKLTGWYGIGIPEIVHFLQARVNRHEAYIMACQNRAIGPVVLVDQIDSQLSESMTNDLFTVVPWSGRQKPEVMTPPQVPPELYSDEDRKIKQIYQISGVSEFAAGAKSRPPTGLDSSDALSLWIEYTDGRFGRQEKDYDAGYVTASEINIGIAKELAADKKMPKANWHDARYGLVDVKWSDVDMDKDVYRLRIQPASSTSTTPAGLRQRLEEERAAGRLADDLYRYVVQTLDVEEYYNLYDAAVANIMRTISRLEDVKSPFPAPCEYQALDLGMWLVQLEWNKIEALGAPPEVLRRLSIWIEQAQALKAMGQGAPVGAAPQLGPGQAGGGPQAPQLQDMSRIPVPGAA